MTSNIIKLNKADNELVQRKVHEKIGDLMIEVYQRRFNGGKLSFRFKDVMGEELEVTKGEAAHEALMYYENAAHKWYLAGVHGWKFKNPKVNLDYIKKRHLRAHACTVLIKQMHAKEMEYYGQWVQEHCTKAKYMNLGSNWMYRD